MIDSYHIQHSSPFEYEGSFDSIRSSTTSTFERSLSIQTRLPFNFIGYASNADAPLHDDWPSHDLWDPSLHSALWFNNFFRTLVFALYHIFQSLVITAIWVISTSCTDINVIFFPLNIITKRRSWSIWGRDLAYHTLNHISHNIYCITHTRSRDTHNVYGL